MKSSTLETITRLTARERLLIASLRGASMEESADKIAALADVVPAQRRSKALQDQAEIALLRGDVPDPDEGW